MLVVGGGPAGAALALLLARDGVAVVLVEHGRAHRSGPFETMLASARALLVRCGLDDVVAAAAEPDPLRHGASWGSGGLVWREPEAGGLLLRRGPFDARLRAAAAQAGAVVRCPAQVRADGDAFELRGEGGEERLHARVVVHATGRGGVRQRHGPHTIACTFLGEPDPADRATAVVEAVEAGWSWTHVPPQGPAACAWFVDGALDPAVRRAAVQQAFASGRGPAARLRDVQLRFANDATPTVADAVPAVLSLGDAVATADPLSSQGVEKALAAAEHAAAIVRTALGEPACTERLFALHRRWELGLATAHRGTAQQWYGREDRFAAAPFWRARTVAVPSPLSLPEGHLQAASTLTMQPVLVRNGARFARVDGVRDSATGDERSHIGYVPIAPVLAAFALPRSLGDAVRQAGTDARLFVLPPRAVHAAMLELVRLGWLVPTGLARA